MDSDLHRTILAAGTGSIEAPRTVDGWFARRRLRRLLRAGVGGRALAIDDRLLVAPLSGRPCLCWVIEIRELAAVVPPGAFVTGGRWALFAGDVLTRDQSAIPFVLADRDRRIDVDPHAAELALSFDHRSWSLDPANNCWIRAEPTEDPAQRRLRERYGFTPGGWFAPTVSLEYREAIVAPGQPITVAGTASGAATEPLPSTPFRDGGAPTMRLAGSPRRPLVISG